MPETEEAALIIVGKLGTMDWKYRDFLGNIGTFWELTRDFWEVTDGDAVAMELFQHGRTKIIRIYVFL